MNVKNCFFLFLAIYVASLSCKDSSITILPVSPYGPPILIYLSNKINTSSLNAVFVTNDKGFSVRNSKLKFVL